MLLLLLLLMLVLVLFGALCWLYLVGVWYMAYSVLVLPVVQRRRLFYAVLNTEATPQCYESELRILEVTREDPRAPEVLAAKVVTLRD